MTSTITTTTFTDTLHVQDIKDYFDRFNQRFDQAREVIRNELTGYSSKEPFEIDTSKGLGSLLQSMRRLRGVADHEPHALYDAIAFTAGVHLCYESFYYFLETGQVPKDLDELIGDMKEKPYHSYPDRIGRVMRDYAKELRTSLEPEN